MQSDRPMHTWFFCAVLVFIGLIGSLTIDMYVPVMPAVAKSLGVSAAAIELSLSLYLIPYAIGQLFCGSLSDCFGRKSILLPAIAIGMMGSAFCAIASTTPSFMLVAFYKALDFQLLVQQRLL